MTNFEILIDYIKDSEYNDFLERCEEQGLTEGEGLVELNHIYAVACRLEVQCQNLLETFCISMEEIKAKIERL